MNMSDPETLRLAADMLLLAGLIAGWIAWLRAGRRQRRLEAMLAEAAAELDAATRQLRETARLLQAGERTSRPEPEPAAQTARNEAPAREKAGAAAPSSAYLAARAYRRHAATSPGATAPRTASPDASGAKTARRPAPDAAPAASAPTEKILRMQREGASPEAIASALNLPLAQVRLIQKLHAASVS